jgi:hypothetical protein
MIVPLTNEDGKREITEGMKGKTASLLPRDMGEHGRKSMNGFYLP